MDLTNLQRATGPSLARHFRAYSRLFRWGVARGLLKPRSESAVARAREQGRLLIWQDRRERFLLGMITNDIAPDITTLGALVMGEAGKKVLVPLIKALLPTRALYWGAYGPNVSILRLLRGQFVPINHAPQPVMTSLDPPHDAVLFHRPAVATTRIPQTNTTQ